MDGCDRVLWTCAIWSLCNSIPFLIQNYRQFIAGGGDQSCSQRWLESNILTRRDWIIRLSKSGDVIGRGTSSWVMMNSNTRRLARIPSDVWEEIIVHCPNPSL
ncbi:unnamed protein product [Closterium sp. Naga37s-1]|nr:unnamed protein product [Closterium sp. Naga37s-1]